MAERDGSSRNDRDGADMAAMEMIMLDRLLYRNRSQHRSSKYFTCVLEVSRACRALAAPKLPDLLAEGLHLIARVPDNRNCRAREAWVRSAAAGLRRMRVAAVACAYSLECMVQASKYLAHQVSQTYFMALSTVFLAGLARLFACNLHLGGRLLEVHGALLRTFLSQPCTSECVSAAQLAECRMPGDTASFLCLLRSAGGTHQTARRVSNAHNSSSSAVAVLGAGGGESSSRPVSTSSSASRTGQSPPGELSSSGVAVIADADDSDSDDLDDTGVHVGHVALVELEKNRPSTAGRKAVNGNGFGRIATALAASRGAGGGRQPATMTSGVGDGTGGARKGNGAGGHKDGDSLVDFHVDGGDNDANPSGGGGLRGIGSQRKQVMLASEFSDSCSDDCESEIDNSIAGRDCGRKRPQQSQSTSASPLPEPADHRSPVQNQPSLFWFNNRWEAPQPQSRPSIDRPNSSPATLGKAEGTAPLPPCPGDVGVGDGVVVAAVGAQRISPSAAGEAWMIDARPTPPVDTPLPRRVKRARKRGNARLAAALPITRSGHEETASSAVQSAVPDDGGGFRDEAPIAACSTSLESGMLTGGDCGSGGGGSIVPARNSQDVAVAKEGTGVGLGVMHTTGRRQAALSNPGSGIGGGEDDGEGSPSSSRGLSEDAESVSRPVVARNGFPGAPDSPGIGAAAAAAAAASTAKISSGLLGSATANRASSKRKVQDGDGSENDAGCASGIGGQAPQPAGASRHNLLKGSIPGAVRVQSTVTGKKLKAGGGGKPGTKRRSSGEGRGDDSKEAKDLKKTKKKNKAKNDGKRGGARNAIDDIFDSLL